jgi:hypothetical protein
MSYTGNVYFDYLDRGYKKKRVEDRYYMIMY